MLPVNSICMISRRLIAAALLAFGLAQSTKAQDWTQWRGPTRDGLVPAANVPASWPDSLRRVWRVEIGEGYSSPIVADGRAFVHSRRDPDEIVMAIELTSGKFLWQQ